MFKQVLIPGFPDGAQKVGKALSILERDGRVTYFVGGDNYFSHPISDEASRRFALATLMANNHVRAVDLEGPPLCIPHRTLMNWKAQLASRGTESFFRAAPPRRPRVMSPALSAECGALLDQGHCPSEVARRVGINDSTLRKALQRKAVPELGKRAAKGAAEAAAVGASEGAAEAAAVGVSESAAERRDKDAGSTKAERSREDAEAAAGIGTACTRADERVAAAMGLAQCAATRFEPARDVRMAGLLTGLPALCANGLLSGLGKYLQLPRGFYSALHIILVLGFMALARIRRPEQLRHVAPGEFGKVIGLDRVPEVRTLRQKIAVMAATGNPGAWIAELAKSWMNDDPEEAGYLYVDGHVRVYHGELANLPRRYVSRERLCLRGTTDYWVNDAVGRPFFVVSKALTDGLAQTLLDDIVPQLLQSVPQQPTEAELRADPLLHRFVVVFDREGATHSLLSQLWKQRIGALTYRKNVKDIWAEAEFTEQEVAVPGGGTTRMKLAMRQSRLGAGKASMPVTEVRRLTTSGHQTAIIATAQHLGTTLIAGRMFSRWCQENFFAYMMQHYDLDGLIEYGTESLPGTQMIVNPAWRELDKAIRQARQVERTQLAQVARTALADGKDIEHKAQSIEAMQAAQTRLSELRQQRKLTPKKIRLDSLPEDQRPTALRPLGKMFADAVKMIAYRAETALVVRLRRHLANEAEARALVRELLVSDADIEPDDRAKTLTIRVHRMASPSHDKAVAALLDGMSSTG
jgi:hypothetical protein